MDAPFTDDADLIEGCIRRDMASWYSFVKKYSPLISISIETRLKRYDISVSRQDIDDIRQNILTSIWKDRKLDGVKNRADLRPWLAIVSGNAAAAYARTKFRNEPQKTISIFEKIGERELVEFIPSEAADPGAETRKAELSQKIDKAIESLPPKEKLIIKLNILYDKKYDEISEIVNLPKGTVSSYIKRAKDKLKEALKDFK